MPNVFYYGEFKRYPFQSDLERAADSYAQLQVLDGVQGLRMTPAILDALLNDNSLDLDATKPVGNLAVWVPNDRPVNTYVRHMFQEVIPETSKMFVHCAFSAKLIKPTNHHFKDVLFDGCIIAIYGVQERFMLFENCIFRNCTFVGWTEFAFDRCVFEGSPEGKIDQNVAYTEWYNANTVLREGEFTAYKAVFIRDPDTGKLKRQEFVVLTLAVPTDAQRYRTGLYTNYGRVSHATVVAATHLRWGSAQSKFETLQTAAPVDLELRSLHNPAFAYTVGETVYADSFDPCATKQETNGIHVVMREIDAVWWGTFHINDDRGISKGKFNDTRLLQEGYRKPEPPR